MNLSKLITAALTLLLALGVNAQSAIDSTSPKIHIVYLGGNDCPPCVAWRVTELPKLQKTNAFKGVTFSHVIKAVGSAVPSAFFLPNEVKPFKDKLDIASGGNRGSAQVAVLVNGEVYDYFFGTRSAAQYEKMILAIQQGATYPEQRCTRRRKGWDCADEG